jgi:TolB-like protein/class 3 adenylate cyclase
MSQSRQLAAIMFTDIVGYSALMGNNEQNAFDLLKKNRELQKPVIEIFKGRWIKELGDGVMASFNTVSDAVNAAIKIQEDCNAAKDFQLRIGIHLSEVVFENDDVFGDGVNIASRIQSAAKPGAIYISESVYNNISNKQGIETSFVKQETLKNVKEPVRIYEVIISSSVKSTTPTMKEQIKKLTEKSIAVLPFVNMSNDPDQDYFCDGLSEELLNVLSHVDSLRVAARTSSFSFKGKNVDILEIGQKLKVNSVLEGSVRKSGNKLRITAQLINIEDGYHLWSERYDRELEDIFDIQDEISIAILGALKVKLLGSEKAAVLKRYTDNTEAYQLYLQGRFHYNKWAGFEGYMKAVEYYNEAVKKDSEYVLAHTGLASCYLNLWFFSHLPPEESLPKMKEATFRSLEIDDEIAESHVSLARMKFWYEWDFEGSDREFKRAIELNSNHAEAHEQYSMFLGITERPDEASHYARKAIELDPFSLMINWGTGWTYFMIENYSNMRAQAKKLIELEPNFYGGHLILGTENWTMGRFEEALSELTLAVAQNNGSFTLSFLGCLFGNMDDQEKAKMVLEKLKDMIGKEPVGNYDLASVYAGMGDKEFAVKCLEKGFEQHEGMMVFLKQWAKLIPWYKNDPRIIALAKMIGLS